MSGIKYSVELIVSSKYVKIKNQINENIIFSGIAKIQRIIDAMKPKTGSIIRKGIVIKAIKYLISGKNVKKALKFPK